MVQYATKANFDLESVWEFINQTCIIFLKYQSISWVKKDLFWIFSDSNLNNFAGPSHLMGETGQFIY